MTNEDWTDLLREKMEAHEAPVPDGLWEEIEAHLPDSPAVRRTLWTPFRRYAAAAAIAIVLLGGAGLLWLHNGEERAESSTVLVDKHQPFNSVNGLNAADDIDKTDTNDVNHVDTENADAVNHMASTTPAAPNNTIASIKTIAPIISQATVNTIATTTPFSAIDTISSVVSINTPADNQAVRSDSTSSPVYIPTIHEEEERILQALEDKDRHQRHHGTAGQFGLFAANSLSSLNASGDADNAYYDSNSMYYNDMRKDGLGNIGYSSPLYRSLITSSANDITYDTHEKAHHHRPISIGLSYSQPLTHRLSLQTGLVYTRLRTDFETKRAIGTALREQTLHYIGIPVNMSYAIWQQHHWSVYANGGVQTDLNVKATVKNNGETRHIDNDRLQISVLLGIGGQYNFTPHFGLYCEPSLRYYPDNGSTVKNYFKDEPWKISLHVGLRLTPFSR